MRRPYECHNHPGASFVSEEWKSPHSAWTGLQGKDHHGSKIQLRFILDSMSATALYKALLDAGADEELAERAAEVLPPIGELATKADVSELKTDIARLETRLDETATKTELAELRTELKAYLAWRLLGGMALMLSIAVAFIRLT